MRRRRKVEGLTLDLRRIEEGAVFTVEDVIVIEKDVKQRAERQKWLCSSCGTLSSCADICGNMMCYMCRRLQDASADVVQYIRNAYRGPCSLCGTHATTYHYDHINMFDKTACILDLVHMPLDIIAAEIAKCQLVCVPCHAVITAAEIKLGYLKKKKRLGREERAGKDISKNRAQFATQYALAFAPIYAGMRVGGCGAK